MKLKSIILGVAITAVLLCVLVATRLMETTREIQEFEIREVETVTLPEPPVPESASESSEQDQLPTPPPALADLSPSVDVSLPSIPVPKWETPSHLTVDPFFSDTPPSPLPVAKHPQPRVATRHRPSVKRPKHPHIKPKAPTKTPKPRPKSQYALSELDKKPRLLHNPSVTFPRSIKTTNKGRVVVKVAISPSGKSHFLSIVSSSHPALNPLARRIANGSRFTRPTRRGIPVKVVMTWPIVIKK